MKALIFVSVLTLLAAHWPKDLLKTFCVESRRHALRFTLRLSFFIPLIAGVFYFDQALLSAIQALEAPVFRTSIRFGGLIGDNKNFWAALIASFCALKLLKLEKHASLSLWVIFSSVLTGASCQIWKHLTLRSRPSTFGEHVSFFNIDGFMLAKSAFLSFPSGDVSIVAGAAAFLFFAHKGTSYRFLFLAFPVLTALSRVYVNRHWPSDGVFAIALGLFCAYLLLRTKERIEQVATVETRLVFVDEIIPETNGVILPGVALASKSLNKEIALAYSLESSLGDTHSPRRHIPRRTIINGYMGSLKKYRFVPRRTLENAYMRQIAHQGPYIRQAA